MANLNAILKNKMGLSAEQAKKSKVLASLSGSYRQNMKSIHYPMRRKTPCFSYGDIRRVHRIYASN